MANWEYFCKIHSLEQQFLKRFLIFDTIPKVGAFTRLLSCKIFFWWLTASIASSPFYILYRHSIICANLQQFNYLPDPHQNTKFCWNHTGLKIIIRKTFKCLPSQSSQSLTHSYVDSVNKKANSKFWKFTKFLCLYSHNTCVFSYRNLWAM